MYINKNALKHIRMYECTYMYARLCVCMYVST